MSRIAIYGALSGLILCISSAALAQNRVDSEIEKMGNQMVNSGQSVGMAVGVIKDGKTYEHFFGTTKKGTQNKPNAKTLFMIGSVTKTFTAALLAEAVDEGKAKLSDPLVNYLPDVSAASREKKSITLLELADHGSGIPRRTKEHGNDISYKKVNAEFVSCRLAFKPGTGYLYSNFGYGLLGGAELNFLHARKWEDLVKTRITEPLGMDDTGITLTPQVRARLASSYQKNGEPAEFGHRGFPGCQAAGAIYSDLDDMMKYLAWMMGTTGPSSRTAELDRIRPVMLTPHNPFKSGIGTTGLAWQIMNMPGGGHCVTKDGIIMGFVTWVGFVPGKNVGVVVMSNMRANEVGPAKKLLVKLAGTSAIPDSPADDSGSGE